MIFFQEFFIGVEIRPSLLHGDLWSGNAGQSEGKPGNLEQNETCSKQILGLRFQAVLLNMRYKRL